MRHSRNSTPRVLVGIPTLNRPDYVQVAIRSVLDQTFQDFRILVSDNASEEQARDTVRSFVERLDDPRVRYHQQPKNIREYGNCDYLFRQCEEDFFVIFHDDDVLEPTYLETAVQRLEEHPETACFLSNAKKIDSEGRLSPEKTEEYRIARGRDGQSEGPVRILEPLMRTGFVSISGAVFRAAAVRKAGFVDEDCFGLYPFEFNVLFRLGECDGLAYFATDELIRYRFHDGQMQRYQGISADPVAVGMMIQLLERRSFDGEAERLRRRVLAIFYNFQARIGARRGDMPACRRALRRGIRADPWWHRHWPMAACAFVVPPLTRSLVGYIDSRRRPENGI